MGQDLEGFLPLEKSWTGPAGDIQAEAFYEDPLYVLLFPDEEERRQKMPLFVILAI